jgi:hypothetical protein
MLHEAQAMSLWVKILLSLVVGLALGFVILAAGMLVGGLGHGWTTPLWFSFVGPVVCPIVVFRVLSYGDNWLGLDFGLLVLALVLDFSVYAKTVEEGTHFFFRMGQFAYVWIGLWSIWQVLIVIKLVAALILLSRKTAETGQQPDPSPAAPDSTQE